MNFRVFGRSLSSGFALPRGVFSEDGSSPKIDGSTSPLGLNQARNALEGLLEPITISYRRLVRKYGTAPRSPRNRIVVKARWGFVSIALLTVLSLSLGSAMSADANTAPTNVVAVPGVDRANLTWTAPANSGFDFSFNGTTYNSVFVGSNTYLTFGSGSTAYSSLSAGNPPFPGVHMCSKDNSYQRVQFLINNSVSPNQLRIRYEGNNSTSGTVGSPTIVYEAVFYRGQNYFDLLIGANSACAQGGFRVITNGSSALSTPNFLPNTNWRITGGTAAQNSQTAGWIGSSSATLAPGASGFTALQDSTSDDAYLQIPAAQAAPTGYAIRYSSNNGASWTTFTSNTGTTSVSSTVTGLSPATTYVFQVAPVTSGVIGTWSASSTAVTTKAIPAAISVSGSTVDPGGEWFNGTWYTSSSGTSNVTPASIHTQLSTGSATLSSQGSITVSAAISTTATNALSFTCGGSGAFTNSSGSITTSGNLTITCATVTISAALQSSGSTGISITANAGAVAANSNLTTTVTTTGGVQLRATTSVSVGNSLQVSTNGGPAVFWARYNSLNTPGSQSVEGLISIGSGVVVTTKGGPIVLAGSSSTDANQRPNGFAYSNSTSYPIRLGTDQNSGASVTLSSGGGDIRIYGESGDGGRQAFAANTSASNSVTVNSGSGRQDWRLVGSNTEDNVFETWGGNLEVTSAANFNASLPAINLSIRQNNISSKAPPIQQVSQRTTKFIVTGTGALSAEITSANIDHLAIDRAEGLQFLANGGDINLNFGVNGLNLATSTTANPFTVGAVSGQSSTSNVVIKGDKFGSGGGSAGFVVRTSGTVAIEPHSSSFSSVPTVHEFDPTWSFVGPSRLTIGKLGNTSAVTLSTINSVAGDLRVLAGTIAINANQTTTNGGNMLISPSGAYSATGTLTSAGTISVIGGTSVGPGATISAAGNITLSGTGNFTNTNAPITSSAGAVQITTAGSSTATVSSNIQATAGSIAITAGGAYSGAGALTAGSDLSISGTQVSLSGALQAANDVEINSTSLTVSQNISSTSGQILLKSTGHIQVDAGTSASQRTIQTSGGDITFQSDADSSGSGYIWINNFNTVSTGAGAGNILISGSSNPLTGFATAGSGDGTNRAGVTLGAFTSNTPVNAERVLLSAGTGNVTIRGASAGNSQGRGILIPLSTTTSNKTSITGQNVTLVGQATGSGNWYGVEFGQSTEQTATNVMTLVDAEDVLSLTGSSATFDGIVANGNVELIGKRVALTGSGPRQPIRIQNLGIGTTRIEAGSTGFSYTGTKTNIATNASAVFSPGTFSSTGPVDFTFDSAATTGALSIESAIATTNSAVTVKTNELALTGTINAGTNTVKLEPFTSSRAITAGSEVTGSLALSAQELGQITANILRLETGNDVNFTANLNFTNKVSTLAVRAGRDVRAAEGISVVVTNLGIDAVGTIDMPGTGNTASVIALNAAGVIFGQSANYSVATVDQIIPEFGLGTKFTLTGVDRTRTVDEFMAVTFNPPPVITIQDKFGNTLAERNLSAANYTVAAAVSSSTATSGTLSLSGAAPTRVGGVHTFSDLMVSGGSGAISLAFTASRTGFNLTDTETNSASVVINYSILAGEPHSLSVSLSSSARSGKTGIAPVVTIKDITNRTITTGTHQNAQVSIAISGQAGEILSGATATTSAGVASFPDLILGGKINTNYTLSFSVSFIDSSSPPVTRTVTTTETVTLLAGDATKLGLGASSQSAGSRANLAPIEVIFQDAYGNPTAFVANSPDISLSVDAVSAPLQAPTLRSGGSITNPANSVTLDTTENQTTATFNDLSLSGKTGSYSVTFTSGSLTPVTQSIELTHGVAHSLVMSGTTSAINDGAFDEDLVVEIFDEDLNPVTGASAQPEVEISASGAVLSGDKSEIASNGIATFQNLKLTGTVGQIRLTAKIMAPGAITNTRDIELLFGAASRVEIVIPAAGFVNRVQFETQPEIIVKDVSGNTVENFSGPIDVTVSSLGNQTATLDGTKTAEPIANSPGSFVFSDLSLRGKVGQYRLSYQSGNLDLDYQDLTLTHGAASKLSVSSGVSTAQAGVAFSSPTVVQILDADENLVSTGAGSQGTISVALKPVSGLDQPQLSGPLTASALEGQASFGDLVISSKIGSFQLDYSLSPLLSVSQNVTLLAGIADSIEILQQPTDAVAGMNLNPTVRLQLVDAWMNPILLDSTTEVTASLVDPAASNVDSVLVRDVPTNEVTLSSGVGTFTGLDYDLAGQHKIKFSAGAFAALSQSFTITPAAANKMVWVQQPVSLRSDIVVDEANVPILEVRDEFDNPVIAGPQIQITASVVGSNMGDIDGLFGKTVTALPSELETTGQISLPDLTLKGTAGSYDLEFTATLQGQPNFSIQTDTPVVLSYGLATQLVLTREATEAKAGLAFTPQPRLEIRDSADNLVEDSALTITASTEQGRNIVGSNTAQAVGGVAEFVGLGVDGLVDEGVEIVFSTRSLEGLLLEDTQSVAVEAGVTVKFEITQEPETVKTRGTFTKSVSLTLYDSFSNPVPEDSSTAIQIRLFKGNFQPAAATPTDGGTLNLANGVAENGIVTFTGLSLPVAPAKDYFFKFTLGSYERSSTFFEVQPGAVTQVLITRQPSSQLSTEAAQLSGSPLMKTGDVLPGQPQITLRDEDNYLADNATGSVSVRISAPDSDGNISEGVASAQVVNGVADFDLTEGIVLVGTPAQRAVPAGDYTLTFSYGGVDSDSSDVLKVTNADASKLFVKRGVANGASRVPFTTKALIHILDRYDNLVETGPDADATILASSADAGTTVLGPEAYADNGIAEFESLALGGKVNTQYTLDFRVLDNPEVAPASQSGVTITHGFTKKIAFVNAPSTADGETFIRTGSTLSTPAVIEVQDEDGNRVLNSTRKITATLLKVTGQLDPRDRLVSFELNASTGRADFAQLVMFARPGQEYALRFAADGVTPIESAGLFVRHGVPNKLVIATPPLVTSSETTPPRTFTRTGDVLATPPKLRVEDSDGNLATEVTGSLASARIYQGDGQLVVGPDQNVPAYTTNFVGGEATLSSLAIIATPGQPQKLIFDARIGSQTLTSDPSQNLIFTYGIARSLSISQSACAGEVIEDSCSPGVTGENLKSQPWIEIHDQFGNIVTDYSGEVVVSTTNEFATLSDADAATPETLSVAVVDGVAKFESLNLIAKPGNPVVLNFSSGGLISTSSQGLDVVAAAPAQLSVVSQPVGARTGGTLDNAPVIDVLDEFGNRVLSDSQTVITVSVASSAFEAVLSGETLLTVTEGRADFDALSFIGIPRTNYNLIFNALAFDTDPPRQLLSATSNFFTVKNALAQEIVIEAEPDVNDDGVVAFVTGEKVGDYELRLLDFKKNLAEDNSSTVVEVSVSGGDGLARFVDPFDQTIGQDRLPLLRVTATEGVVRFDSIRVVGTPGETYELEFTANPDDPANSYSVVSSGIAPTHNAPHSLRVIQSPSDNLSGVAFTDQPVVEVLDRYLNLTTENNSSEVSVSAVLIDQVQTEKSWPEELTDASAQAVNGVVTFNNLAASGTPGAGYSLRFDSSDGFGVLDSFVYRLSTLTVATLSYPPTSYAPDGLVAANIDLGGSGASPSFTTNTQAVCLVDPATGQITIKAAGICAVRMEVPDHPFYFGTEAVTTLEITRAIQAVPRVVRKDGGSTFSVPYLGSLELHYEGGEGTGAVEFYSTGANCRIVGQTIVTLGAGTDCRVRVFKLEDANYLEANSPAVTVTIRKLDQAELMIGNSTDIKFGAFNLFTVGGSGTGAVSYQVELDNNVAGCRILESQSGWSLSASQTGSCQVSAIKAESSNYKLARSESKTFEFRKTPQTVTFISAVPTNPVRDMLFEPVAVASSGERAIRYEIVPGSFCAFSEIEPTKVVFGSPGLCEIRATQPGTDTIAAASAVLRIEIGKTNQNITFDPIADRRFSQPMFWLMAKASSNLPVSYQVADSSVCQIGASGTLIPVGAGVCSITASQPGNTVFFEATPVTRMFKILADTPGAPHIVSLSSADQSITVSFKEPGFTGGSEVLRYRLEATRVGSTSPFVNSNCMPLTEITSCTIEGIPNNQEYSVKVAAINSAGNGPYAQARNLITPVESPQAVTDLSAMASVGLLELNWSAPLAVEGAFIRYDIYVWSNEMTPSFSVGLVKSLPGDINVESTTISLPELDPLNNMGDADGYKFALVTVSSVYSSPLDSKNVTRGEKLGFTTPGIPGLIELTVLEDQLNLGWPAPLYDGGQSIIGYQVTVNGEVVCSAIEQSGIPNCNDMGSPIIEPEDSELIQPRSFQAAAEDQPQLFELATFSNFQPLSFQLAAEDEMQFLEPASFATVENDSFPVGTTNDSQIFEWPELEAGKTYRFEVFAVNALGTGEMRVLEYTMPAPPPPSRGPSAEPTLPTPPTQPAKPAPGPKPPSVVDPETWDTDKKEPAEQPTLTPPAAPETDTSAAASDSESPAFIPGAPVANPAIGATGDDNAPPVPFDPLSSPEAVAALTDTLGNAAAAVGAIAAAAAAGAAAAAAAGGAAAGGGGGSGGGSRAPAGGSSGGSSGSGEGGSIATIDTSHERYRNKRRGRGDRWKIWKKKWLTFSDNPFIAMVVKTARFSPLFSKIAVDGAYLRAAFGSFGLLPTIAASMISLGAIALNDGAVAPPQWQWFIVLAVIGIFDAFAGLIGTVLFVIGTLVAHGSIGLDDVRLLLGVIIVGYGPALLANAFRSFRKEPEDGGDYWWERLVDLVVLPFIGGWVTATMISTLPALAGTTLSVANHVGTFSLVIAVAITGRVLLEEFVARWFPARLDTLHPTDVDDADPAQKWISVGFRLSVFIFVTAALMGNVWQVWVGSALFILPTIIGFYSHKFKNFPWIWRILPTGIPGLAFTLVVASVTTSIVGSWFGTSPDLALWSFALLPVPMLALAILGMIGREGNEGEIRWIRRPGLKWVYRLGGILMLLATMDLAGVIELFPF